MKKGKIFKKESTLYWNSYYEKEAGRQLVYKFIISHTGGFTKRRGDLNSAFEKANSPPSPPLQKRESTRKKLVYLPPILQNFV
jgi:hypothetical protein